ncbi:MULTISPECIES: phage baseplate assembly protein V [Serratia]|uniref:phage baseplate assembly protein V n=1 Tax=Serratia TaxID=613 RepID=UPI000744F27D|nr:phage baseplate assembly protein V [Serratia marcescens]MBE8813579.1 phage baseplate assembly protein V [Serratia marcescens]CVC19246.1 Phage P2 baseplate assembly protein gpV [Serratia marcescens]CVD96596.1 Phage P2 baseplate assembly protein gpV [Serratia marcescens]CVF05423.1 Phage P2 baseplate assembly protein gpV [Serratia marcescens]CVH15114.1 Phage P2 baseplate assembly protein gpV [Serratia marcescens]
MSQDMGDLARRVANMIRRGVVQAVKHGRQPQCRVEIGDITTTWLPVCQPSSSANRADSNPIAVGDAVTVISEAGDLNNGRVFPGWNTGKMPVPEGSDSEHVTRYSDGTEIRYDRAAHALKIIIAEGGTYEIEGKGTLRGPVEITDTLTVKGKTELQADTAVTGDLSATGDISDGKSTLARVREIFNIHTHPDPHGGDTDKPNNQM